MDKVSVVLRVFFEDPFWIGILERVESGRMTVCKITFGWSQRIASTRIPGKGILWSAVLVRLWQLL